MSVNAGQVWRAPAPRVHGGFRFVRIEEVRLIKSKDDAYVNAVEITEGGDKARPSRLHPFRGQLITIKVSGDNLPPPYELVK